MVVPIFKWYSVTLFRGIVFCIFIFINYIKPLCCGVSQMFVSVGAALQSQHISSMLFQYVSGSSIIQIRSS